LAATATARRDESKQQRSRHCKIRVCRMNLAKWKKIDG